MKMKLLLLVIAIGIGINGYSQNNWQQQVNYDIRVRLNDSSHMLSGYESIQYKNNSPDTLQYIYMHLWPNAYKSDRTAFAKQQELNKATSFYYAKPEDRGYIDSLEFLQDDVSVLETYSAVDSPDIIKIKLKAPLYPGKDCEISTGFRVKIPKVFSRLGHSGQSYFISQWYPKPAVYDSKGWHAIPYLDQGEFYSEYGNYKVQISLPRNYIVMATGNCGSAKEQAWLDSLAAAPLAKQGTKKSKPTAVVPPSDATYKTISFSENKVHDFAWFADKRWIVRKDTAIVSGNNNIISTWCAFLPEHAKQWAKGNAYLKETLHSYGDEVGAYPYNTIKAVEGEMHAGGGMEYPTVTIIDKGSVGALHEVIVHEAGHNWFYGILGSMERDHAWMDEGINTFYEQKTSGRSTLDSVKKGNKLNNQLTIALLYEHMVRHEDEAIEQTSAQFTNINYGLDVYYKTAKGLQWLEQYMGEKDFKYAMQDYYKQWQFRHPSPEDLQKILSKHSNKNIDWFFTDFLTTAKKIDFAIGKVKRSEGGTSIWVNNKGNQNLPVVLKVYQKDSVLTTLVSEPFRGKKELSLSGNYNWDKIQIDPAIPDCNSRNNANSRGLALKLLGGINDKAKEQIYIAPTLGYNSSDGGMAGLILHNLSLPENRFKFIIAPMYGFKAKAMVGAGSVGYSWFPDNMFSEVLLQADVKHYHTGDLTAENLQEGFTKVAPSILFTFKEPDLHSFVSRELLFKYYQIQEDNIVALQNGDIMVHDKAQYALAAYSYSDDRAFNPYSLKLEAHGNSSFQKISISGNLRVDYNKPGKSLYIRAYFGKLLTNSSDPSVASRYYLNSSFSGAQDYLYDGTYFGRYEGNGLAAQQIGIQEGGFKIPVHGMVGTSSDWLGSVNLLSDLPVKRIPMRLFFDAGFIPNEHPNLNDPNQSKFLYEGGIELYLIKNAVSIYVPLVMSGDLRDYLTNAYGNTKSFARSISFSLRLQNFNLLRTDKVLKTLMGG